MIEQIEIPPTMFTHQNCSVMSTTPLHLEVHLLDDLHYHVIHQILGKLAVAKDYDDAIRQIHSNVVNLYYTLVYDQPQDQQFPSQSFGVLTGFLNHNFCLPNP
jgi:hypothetical protein